MTQPITIDTPSTNEPIASPINATQSSSYVQLANNSTPSSPIHFENTSRPSLDSPEIFAEHQLNPPTHWVHSFMKFVNNLLAFSASYFDSLEENVIWAIGQAYGLPTHFLDWTVNLYIAAYFAFFEKKTNKKCNRVIYSLNQAVQRRKFSEDRFVEFLDLIETCDATQNKRLKNQEGRFTKALNGIDIETNVRNYAKRCCDDIIENKKILLAKIFIPDEFRLECLTDLESLKITHGVLFPDYAGAVAICENDLDLNSLK